MTGSIGNEIFLFAALYGMGRLKGKTVVVSKNKSQLSSWFPLLKALEDPYPEQRHSLVNPQVVAGVFEPRLIIWIPCKSRGRTVTITGYLQSWKYFDYVKEEIRHYLQPSDEDDAIAAAYSNKELRFINVERANAFIVGIHVRRGDYLS